MRRLIALVLILTISFSLFSDPIVYEYEPYEEDEFPIILSEIRRAECIFFGSLIITYPLTAAAYSIAEGFGAQIESDDFALFWQQIGIASCASLLIAGVDWLIGYIND